MFLKTIIFVLGKGKMRFQISCKKDFAVLKLK